jgi:glycosyltransferase involved in cell wall biosynthesis
MEELVKIFIIGRGFPTTKYPKNGIFEFDQTKALKKAGVDLVYLALDFRSFRRKRKFFYESLIKEEVNIEALNLPCGPLHHIILTLIGRIALKYLLNRTIKKYGKPHLIHSHFIFHSYLASKVLKAIKIPLVVTEHFSGLNQEKVKSYLMKWGQQTYDFANIVLVVSNSLKNKIDERFNIKSIYVPNILDIASFKYCIRNINKNSVNLVSVGSLNYNKGMDITIEAFNIFVSEFKKAKLYIIGEGPESKTLKALIEKYNLKKKVILLGELTRDKINDVFKISDFFVLASKSETFGVAYIEALSTGLPVVSTKCGGPEDFLTIENSILSPVDDIIQLSTSMLIMAKSMDKYDRFALSEKIRLTYGYTAFVNNITLIYKSIIRG